MECLETTGPHAVKPDPEQALAPMETDPFAVLLRHHGQLLPKRKDLQLE
jgi:hypothetical protein